MNLTPERLEKAVTSAADLPTLPQMAKSLNQLIRTPQTSASQIGTLISEDQALTAQVLRVVNSAYYGFPRQINNVTHSIVILGFNKVRDIVLMSSILDCFRGRTGNFDFIEFWKHSMGTAIASDALANTLRASCVEDAFVAGLLHDIGKLVLATSFPESFGEALALAQKKNLLLRDAEMDLFGFDHAHVGNILALRWGFTDHLCEAIHHHHNPTIARRGQELASIVHVGDILARSIMIGSGGDNRIPLIDEMVRTNLDLTREEIDLALHKTFQGLVRGSVFFDLIRSATGKEEEEEEAVE